MPDSSYDNAVYTHSWFRAHTLTLFRGLKIHYIRRKPMYVVLGHVVYDTTWVLINKNQDIIEKSGDNQTLLNAQPETAPVISSTLAVS